MTIDEVIAIAKEKADKNSECWKHCTSCDDCDLCEEYHKQLAEWLEELVNYRRFNGAKTFDNGFKQCEKYGYNKAIDEFLNKIYDVSYFVREPKLISGGYSVVTLENIEKIAEQMKEGE